MDATIASPCALHWPDVAYASIGYYPKKACLPTSVPNVHKVIRSVTSYFNFHVSPKRDATRKRFPLHLGDVGYYTEDGSFFVIDRIKDLIKCMDEQVAPAELEEILFKHDDVKEVAVVGVPHSEYGEAARAFVVLFENVPISENIELNLRKLVESKGLLFFISLLADEK